MRAVLLLCLVGSASAWWPKFLPSFGLSQENIAVVKVRATFVCGSAPVADARVRMVDKDFGNDDKMTDGQDFTNAQGVMELEGQGTIDHLGNKPDPVVKVYHRCEYGKPKGKKTRAVFFVPDKYIGTKRSPAPTMDLGTINLEIQTVHSPKGWGGILGRRRRSHRHHRRH